MTLDNTKDNIKNNSAPTGKIDERLFVRIAQGDEKAFNELYYATYKPLYAFAISLTKKAQDAEDLLQETYIKIKGGAHLYKPMGTPMSWIFKIASNIYKMKIRKESKYTLQSIDTIENSIDFGKITDLESRIVIQKAFTCLKDDERNIIIMHLIAGFKHREIAEYLHKPLSTVLSRYNRAIKKLQAALKGKED